MQHVDEGKKPTFLEQRLGFAANLLYNDLMKTLFGVVTVLVCALGMCQDPPPGGGVPVQPSMKVIITGENHFVSPIKFNASVRSLPPARPHSEPACRAICCNLYSEPVTHLTARRMGNVECSLAR